MKDIEQFLRENAPETPDEGQFLIETNARLSAVEGIKQTVDGEHRRWRLALLVALVAGLVLGCLVTGLVLLYPVQPLQADEPFLAKAVQNLQQWLPVLVGFMVACAISLAVVLRTKKREAI
jgi:hypothetical protein